MRRLLAAAGTTVLLWTVGLVTIVNAEDVAPANAVPDSAGLVVRLKSPQESAGKLAEFVDAVQPGFGVLVSSNLPELGRLIGIPGMKGVDLEKDIWLIIFTESQTPPSIVCMLTAKDVAAVTDAIPEEYERHTSGSLVFFSADEDALAEVRKTLGGDAKPLLPQIDAASKKLFEAQDLALLVNIKQLTEDFSDELDQAEPQLEAFIDSLVDAMPEDQQPQLEAVFGLYRDIGKSFLQGVRDSNSWTTGLTFTKSAIRAEDRLQVAPDTATSEFLAKQPPGDFSLLSRFPASKSVYIGMKFDMSSMIDWSMKLTKSMLSNSTAEQLAQFDAALKEMKELKYDDISMYIDLEGTIPAIRIGAVTTVTPGKRAREISHKLLKSMSEIKTPQFTQATKLEANVDKIGGSEIDRVTVKQTFEDSADPLGMQNKMQEILFGDAGMEQLFLYQANRSLQTLGNGTKEMKSLVTSLESTQSDNAAMIATRQRLFEKANFLAMSDVARLLSSGLKLAASQKVIPMDAAALDNLQLEPSYVGYALTIEPTAIRSQLEIPVQQIQNLVKFIPVLQSQR